MESSFLRKHANRVEDAAKAKNAGTTPEKETDDQPTIGQIIRSDSKAFGQMLESQGNPELIATMTRYQKGEPTEADIKNLTANVNLFLETKERIEKLDSFLSNSTDHLRERSEKFKEFSKIFGVEGIDGVLKQGLAEMAYADPARFKKIETYFSKLEKSEKTLDDPESPVNKTLTDFCKKHNLNEDTLLAIMDEQNDALRDSKIASLLHGQLTTFQKFFSWKRSRENASEAAAISGLKTQMDQMLGQDELLAKQSGDYLVALISKNDTWRSALVRTQSDKQPTFKQGIDTKTGFDEIRDDMNPDLKKIGKWWPQYLHNQGINNFAGASPVAQSALRDRFKRDYTNNMMKEAAKKGGFWATVWKFLFAQKMNSSEIDALLK